MLDPKLATDILATVNDRFGSQVAFTQELVRFASLRGQERTCQDFVELERSGNEATAESARWLLRAFEKGYTEKVARRDWMRHKLGWYRSG